MEALIVTIVVYRDAYKEWKAMAAHIKMVQHFQNLFSQAWLEPHDLEGTTVAAAGYHRANHFEALQEYPDKGIQEIINNFAASSTADCATFKKITSTDTCIQEHIFSWCVRCG